MALMLFLPLLTPVVSAQFDPLDSICENDPGSAACDSRVSGDENPIVGPDGVLTNAVKIFSYVAGVAAVIMIIIGGLKFITANGDPNSISSARNTVIYALIGVGVFAAAQLVVRFVISKL